MASTYRRHGMTPAEIIALYSAPQPNGCIYWTRAKDRNGYGHVAYQRRDYRAHRLAWIAAHGEIPVGMVVDHECHNSAAERGECEGGWGCPHRLCVNVDHLRLVTEAKNRLGSPLTLYARAMAPRTHCPQGHEYNADNPTGRRGCGRCRSESRGPLKVHAAGFPCRADRRPHTREMLSTVNASDVTCPRCSALAAGSSVEPPKPADDEPAQEVASARIDRMMPFWDELVGTAINALANLDCDLAAGDTYDEGEYIPQAQAVVSALIEHIAWLPVESPTPKDAGAVERWQDRHWLLVNDAREIVGCHCGYRAPEDDCGYGDSTVAHIVAAATAFPSLLVEPLTDDEGKDR